MCEDLGCGIWDGASIVRSAEATVMGAPAVQSSKRAISSSRDMNSSDATRTRMHLEDLIVLIESRQVSLDV